MCLFVFTCMLDSDLKIPLTYHINCVGGMPERSRTLGTKITGNAPVNRKQMFRWKCRVNYVGGMLEGGLVHVQYVSSRLEEMRTTRICVFIRNIV